MRKVVVAAVFTTAVVVLAATAWGSPQRSQRAASAGNALVKCGKTRSIGLMAPFTGPAASIGGQQVDWAKYYLSTYNKAHKATQIKFVNADTQLGAPTGRRGAQGRSGARLE